MARPVPGAGARQPPRPAGAGGRPDRARQPPRRVALPERRRLGHALLAARPDRRGQLRGPRGGVGLAGRQLRAASALPLALHAELHRRHPLHGGRLPAHDRGHRPRDRRDALDVPRAQHSALGRVDARELRQGSRLRRDRRARRHLHHHAGLLPARARREDRRAPRGLRQAGRDRGLPGDRRRRPARGPRARIRPLRGDPDGRRLHHQLVAADRRQRHGRGRELPRAGLLAVARRERAGRHPGLRRADRGAPLEVQHHSAVGERVRLRHVAERRLGLDGRRLVVGAAVGRPRARHRLHPDQLADHRLLRRVPAGEQPVRHHDHRDRRRERRAGLALPDRAPPDLELRPAQRADPGRRHGRRPGSADGHPDHQAGDDLRLQPRDRRAGLADRGTFGACVPGPPASSSRRPSPSRRGRRRSTRSG